MPLRPVLIALLLIPTAVVAGGDFVHGKIASYSTVSGGYVFEFVPAQTHWLSQGCSVISVQVTPARVPWYSWVPFVSSAHPSALETAEAAGLLGAAKIQNSQVNFGYMGGGLAPTGVPCRFSSKGLRLYRNHEVTYILSFHDPI